MLTSGTRTAGMPLRRIIAIAITFACAFMTLAVAAGGAEAKTIKVPKGQPTIQAAVNAAEPGDLILVSPRAKGKAYFENVSVGENRIRIVGVPRRGKLPIVDGTSVDGVFDDTQFDISGDNVSISRLELRHGNGINCFAERCAFRRLFIRMSDQSGDCIEIAGSMGRVEDSRLRGCDDGAIDIAGGRARVLGNQIRNGDNGCIDIVGNNVVVKGNVVIGCEDLEGIAISGDRATVSANKIRNTDGNAVEIDGARALVRGNSAVNIEDDCYYVLDSNRPRLIDNRAKACDGGWEVDGENFVVNGNRGTMLGDDDGFDLSCEDEPGGENLPQICRDVEVIGNRASGNNNDDEGFDIDGDAGGMLIRANVSRENNDGGYDIDVDDSKIAGNVSVFDGAEGNESGFDIDGDDNVVENNRADLSGDNGFLIDGDDNLVRGNLARQTNHDGLYLGSSGNDNRLVANRALANLADGIENDGTDTVILRNIASGNRRDCANDGTIAQKKGNRCADKSNFTKPGTVRILARR